MLLVGCVVVPPKENPVATGFAWPNEALAFDEPNNPPPGFPTIDAFCWPNKPPLGAVDAAGVPKSDVPPEPKPVKLLIQHNNYTHTLV